MPFRRVTKIWFPEVTTEPPCAAIAHTSFNIQLGDILAGPPGIDRTHGSAELRGPLSMICFRCAATIHFSLQGSCRVTTRRLHPWNEAFTDVSSRDMHAACVRRSDVFDVRPKPTRYLSDDVRWTSGTLKRTISE